MEIKKDDIMRAIIIMAWYNGLEEEILSWAELPKESECLYDRVRCPYLMRKDFLTSDHIDTDAQLIYIWGMMVLLFGDYGTSPRYGWITEVEDFRNFIKKMFELCEG